MDKNGKITDVKCDCTEDVNANDDCEEKFGTRCIDGGVSAVGTGVSIAVPPQLETSGGAIAAPLQEFTIPPKISCVVADGNIGRVTYNCMDKNGKITDVKCDCTEDVNANDDCDERFGTRCIDGYVSVVSIDYRPTSEDDLVNYGITNSNDKSSICNVRCGEKKSGTLYCVSEHGENLNMRGGKRHHTNYDMCVPATAQPPSNATCGPCVGTSSSSSSHHNSSRKRTYQIQRGDSHDSSNRKASGKVYRKKKSSNKTKRGKKYKSSHSIVKKRIRGSG